MKGLNRWKNRKHYKVCHDRANGGSLSELKWRQIVVSHIMYLVIIPLYIPLLDTRLL